MNGKPRCQLCSGALVKEPNVYIQTGGSNVLAYSLAWVCKDCGTAWPIAMTGGGIFKKWKPLWENGERRE